MTNTTRELMEAIAAFEQSALGRQNSDAVAIFALAAAVSIGCKAIADSLQNLADAVRK